MQSTLISTGSVVRINPHELHIKDPYYYDEIYAPSSRKRDKNPKSVGIFGFPNSMVATVGHEHHRFRRGLLSSFFSKRSVLELSPIIHEKKSKLMQRFEKAYQDDNVLELGDAFAAFTSDLISHYSWGVSSGFLDDEKFNNSFRQAINEQAPFAHVYRFFPSLCIIVKGMPQWLLCRHKPKATSVLRMQNTIARQSTSEKPNAETSRKTIFDRLRDPSVPPKERTPCRLEDEGFLVLLGGTEATARALAFAAFYIYQNKPLIEKLREELRQVMPTPTTEVSWTQLEQLPYLVRRVSLYWGSA